MLNRTKHFFSSRLERNFKMVVQPKVRGFICTTAHPTGCEELVRRQIEYVKSKGRIDGAKKVLVIGASMGYGLASRVSAAFGCGAATLGVIFDKPASGSKTATAGWYNTKAFEKFAGQEGLYAKTINGDAYSDEIKAEVIDTIKQDLGKVDLVVYSLAAPRRTVGDTVYKSVLKTTGEPYTNKTIDLRTNEITEITLEPATDEEIDATVKVMGGEDWEMWINALKSADVLAENALTIAYSYIGPEITHPMYFNGSIGRAKAHLLATSHKITENGVKAYVSVNKALVTQSSSAIPIVPLYITTLYKVMKEKGVHEGCIEQMQRLFARIYSSDLNLDQNGQIRMDDLEMREDVQAEVTKIWNELTTENLKQLADLDGYQKDFMEIFGFGVDGVDYSADVSV